jgi:hypothetical protein
MGRKEVVAMKAGEYEGWLGWGMSREMWMKSIRMRARAGDYDV